MKNLKNIQLLVSTLLILASCGKRPPVSINELTKGWTFKSTQDTLWKPAKVPGVVHTDLLANDQIAEPFYRLNEHNLQWIDKLDWHYQTVFDIPKKSLDADHIELEFLGLDTYSRVYLNDHLILESDNMFRSYEIDIKSLIKKGENQLKVVLESPIKHGLAKYDSLGFQIPVSDNDLAEIGQVEQNKQVSIFSRKAGYHFGWDWGPRLVSSGIWRPINLRIWNNHRIEDLFIEQLELNDQVAKMNARIALELGEGFDDEVQVALALENEMILSQPYHVTSEQNVLNIPFEIPNPKRWWPNGMGEQQMYEVSASVTHSRYEDIRTRKVGLRTIELIQENDSIGTSFYLKVNGVPTFMKGANYIPQDVFLPRVSAAQYGHILQSAKAANMNMLRVWGGGIYENDTFYDMCDELGLLVWQDFMFACAMFPGDQHFLDNVRQEAVDNVVRLRNHPSIALWCGNNEVLSAWENWGWKDKVIQEQSTEVADKIWKAYDDIFHRILPQVVNTYDSSRFYWPSSPGSSFGKTENLVAGDAHYWMVWWGKEPFENYNKAIPRFMSEFGFQSFPNMPTINQYTAPEDYDIYSEVMQSHQRSSIGNVTIDEYMKRHFRTPKDFESFIYTSQVLQAIGIKTGIEAHRRSTRCMGSLYWQINDCWPVASWSSIDYYGNWKALHYQVKRSFDPLIMSFEDTESSVDIHVVSDSLKEVTASISIRLIDFNGNTLDSWHESVVIKPNTADKYYSIPTDRLVNVDKKSVLLVGELIIDQQLIASGLHYFTPFKDMELPDPELAYETYLDNEDIIVRITANQFAKSVYLSDGTLANFSDNYFDMLPNTTKEVRIPKGSDSLYEFRKNIKVISLYDTY